MAIKEENRIDQEKNEAKAPSSIIPAKSKGNNAGLRSMSELRKNPTDFSISLAAKGGTDNQLLNPPTERVQRMRGFDDTYIDIIDYIVRVTHRIWEDKDIGYIYETYKHNSRVWDDYGLQYGRDKIVADTIHTVNAFPDIRLIADEIVWAGDDEVGFHTSHRCLIIGHNTGYSRYGLPTGKKVVLWVIANCVALENEIFDEWVVYDTASMIYQLGFDLREKAREFGNQMETDGVQDLSFGEPERLPGQGKPLHMPRKTGSGFDVEDFIRHHYHYIWNWRMLSKVDDAYTPSMRFRGSTGRAYHGRSAYKNFILSMMAMFPDLVFQIDDIYWMGNDQDGYITSVRWSIVGTHRGAGIYGTPTGRNIRMWGITQHSIKDGKIEEEWMLFNEFAVMQQIYRD
ncbi:MAG: ester cyclase [Anaerolineae bacterium]|nr:ester cyclase [Anaerolineae bacterium]MDK1117479.1 ester cyclase [Anaerolineae bacterium]